MSAWNAAGRDTLSLSAAAAAPFVSASDFHLKAGAPAVDVGVSRANGVTAPMRDAEGASRPIGAAVDLGAYERAP